MSDKPDLSVLFSMLASNGGSKNMVPEELLVNLMNSSSTQSASYHTTGNNANDETSNNNDAWRTMHTSTNKEAKNISADANKESSSDGTGTNSIPDMEMMMKLMQILKSSNQNSPSKELLRSLKPFLNDSRKEKVDQYIKILGMTKALEIFNELGDTPK